MFPRLWSVAAVCLLQWPLLAVANTAISVVQVGGAGGGGFSTFGYTFVPAANVTVTQLGVYDVSGDGLGEAHAVGIWTAGGTLLVSGTVPAGIAAPLSGGSRYVDVTGTALTAGQTYVIGAYYLTSADFVVNDGFNSNVLDYDPFIAPGNARFGINQFSGLAFPGSPATDRIRLGPNFVFTPPAVTTRTWPTDPAPCNDVNNLDNCINGANAGDTIRVALNSVPSQTVDVTNAKNFTLQPAPGFTPVFSGFSVISIAGGTLPAAIVVEGLTFVNGWIQAGSGAANLDLTLRQSVFQDVPDFRNALDFLGRSGPTRLRFLNNNITVNVSPVGGASAISASGFTGPYNSVLIGGNRIVQNGGGQSGAIAIQNNTAALNVDLIGNDITGSDYNHGISLGSVGAGQLRARVLNNRVSGQVDSAGGPAAIAMYVSEGAADFKVINNTVAYNQTGIQLGGRPDLGATATALISNNIAAFNSRVGFNLQDFPATTVNDYNTDHGNGTCECEFTPGPGTLTSDPLFVSSTDLRLLAGSPARNTGLNSRVPFGIATDLDGNPRIQGIVDRGAYELAAGGIDTDIDGVADSVDNCRLVFNSDQRDTNGDKYGNICDPDFNGTGIVDSQDASLMRARFGSSVHPDQDLNGTGTVDSQDVSILRARFGQAPGPSGYFP